MICAFSFFSPSTHFLMPTSPTSNRNDAHAQRMRMIYGQLALAQTILMDELADPERPNKASSSSSPQND